MFQDNRTLSRYELDEGLGVAFAEYRDSGKERALTHWEVPLSARGRGTAGRLMEQVLADARQNKRQLRALCPYAVAWLQVHPEAGDVLR
ncbi:MAG: GNAT family N-acetyltransferase [Hyphomonadaceae bacterium]